MRVGVISDTHRLLRPEAVAALAGVEHILHAGDVGDVGILEELARIAPVTAIRGNIDGTGRCATLAATEMVELAGATIYMLHDVHQLDLDPVAAGVSVVVSGHSHRASMERRRDVLYFNPGSAGRRRFSLPVTLGFLSLGNGLPQAEIVKLLPDLK